MKRFSMLLAAGLAVFALAACSGITPLTFQQQVGIACAAGNAELTTLQVSGIFTGGAQATLTTQVQPDVAKVCAQGATVTTTNLQNLVNATLPAVQMIVDNSTLSADDKKAATLAIGAVAGAVNLAIALHPAAVVTTPPASAPTGASGTLVA